MLIIVQQDNIFNENPSQLPTKAPDLL